MRRALLHIAVSGALLAGALAQGEEGGLSNPLWSTPLDRLAATRERPIFSQSRRPPPLAESPVVNEERPSAAPGAPPFSLVGTVVGEREKIAVLQETGSQNVVRLTIGASASGWSVAEVAPRSVTLRRGPQSVTLELPKPVLR